MSQAFESDIAQVLLETALSLGDVPAAGDVASFLDATCLLKVPRTEEAGSVSLSLSLSSSLPILLRVL